jgi:O-antigen/teichoic acid export membrane protein
MDKAMNMGKSSATGSFQLLIGVVASTVIMALGTIVLGWLLSRDQLGIYGVALIPSSMINFFRDWGVNSAMTKEIARLRAAGQEAEIRDVIVSGTVFEIVSGAVLSAVCFGVADLLAAFLRMPEASLPIAIMSLSIFAGAVLAAATNIFVGFEKMKFNSLTTVLQAVVKTAVGPLLVVLGFGVLGAIIGAAVSFLVGAAIGITIVYFVLFRPLDKVKTGRRDIRKILRPMLSFGVPLTVANTVIGVSPLLFAFLMAPIAGTSLMGDYYAASYFTVLLTFFTIPISTALFPAFAKVNVKAEPELLRTVFASSIRYTSILVVPATMIVIALSGQMLNTLWPGKFPYAPLFLSLVVIINLYVVFGSLSLGSLMTGIGETGQLMLQSLLSLALSVPLVIILIAFSGSLSPPLGAVIGILGILLSSLPGTVWGLFWVWRRYKVKADFQVGAKILTASGISAVASYLTASLVQMNLGILGFSTWTCTVVSLLLGFIVFMVLYLGLAPVLGAISQVDVNNMRSMFGGSGIVSKALELPFRFMERSLRIRRKKSTSDEVK